MLHRNLTGCRSWLFIPGHDTDRLDSALASGADAIVIDLEEFTPAESRETACHAFANIAESCRRKGLNPMVRINALDERGREELALLMSAAPTAVFLPKVEETMQLTALSSALDSEEKFWGISPGSTAIVPTLESRLGVERASELLHANPRISAALLGTGDLASDLKLSAKERSTSLAPFRQFFLKACGDADILAIDGPWPEVWGFEDDQIWSYQCGFRARCVVDTRQVKPLHQLLSTTPPNYSFKEIPRMSHSALPSRNGGQILIQQLRQHGARRVFLVPGESYLPCIDALNEHRGAIEPIVCRQESGAGYMAEAYGKLTNEPGICFVTRGPGATNASIAVHTAYQDSTPMILFIGQVGNDFIEREAFQEIDYRRMFGPMAKWVAQIDDTARIPEFIARAYSVATSGRPGPVVLALPEDTLWGEACVADVEPRQRLHSYPSQQQLRELQQHLERAEKPFLLLGGSGWTKQAQMDIAAFAERYALPVGVAWRRLECFNQHHENFVGHVGSGMHQALREQLKSCDLIITLGARLGEPTTEGYSWIASPTPNQTLVHIYPDPEELGHVYRPDLAINADVVGFSTSLGELNPESTPSWHQSTITARLAYLDTLTPLDAPGRLSLDKVTRTVDQLLNGKGCITVGAGNYALYAHRYIQFSGLGSSLAPTVGAMGYGLPAAISSKLEHPQRPTICFAGDGCFQMNLQELGVALQYRLGIVILVFNNGMWGTIRAHQEHDFPGREIALTFTNPKFDSLIKAYGGHGEIVEDDASFEAAFSRALAFTEQEHLPALIELRYDADGIAPGERLSAIRAAALGHQNILMTQESSND